MSKHRVLGFLAILLPAALVACSGDDASSGDPGPGTQAIPSAFTKYCMGTLKTERELMSPYGSGWSGNGKDMAAPGTEFVIEAINFEWGGYVISADGTPKQINNWFENPLVKDTDFTSECAIDPKTAKTDSVLLMDATLYDNAELSGTGCTLKAGTVLTDYSFYGGFGGPGTLSSSPEVKEQCGWDKAYTKDFSTGHLVVK